MYADLLAKKYFSHPQVFDIEPSSMSSILARLAENMDEYVSAYRQTVEVSDPVQVAKLLLLQHAGVARQLQGYTLKDIEFESKHLISYWDAVTSSNTICFHSLTAIAIAIAICYHETYFQYAYTCNMMTLSSIFYHCHILNLDFVPYSKLFKVFFLCPNVFGFKKNV